MQVVCMNNRLRIRAKNRSSTSILVRIRRARYSCNTFCLLERPKPERTEVPYISDISWESVSILESEVLKPQHRGR